MIVNERWLPIPGCEGSYEVSDHGRVRSLDRVVIDKNGRSIRLRGQILKLIPHVRDQYPQVGLPPAARGHKGGTSVHILVLEAFVGPRPSPDMDACHANDIRTDNRVSNLRWDTKTANAQDAVRNKRLVQQQRTHCPQRHEYTPENTYIKPSEGRRRCKRCLGDAQRRARGTRARSVA